MARTLTEQQAAVLTAPAGYGATTRVLVLRDSTWVNLSALGPDGSLDFLQEAEVSTGREQPVAQASVKCLREASYWILAPLVTTSPINLVGGSYEPLLQAGRDFKVETAVVPLGMEPTDADWLLTFHGRIDSVDVATDCVFEGRDLGGGRLQDTYLETERTYGSDSGVDVERVMAAILSDNLLWPGYARWLPSHTYVDASHVLPTAGKGTGWLYIGDALSGSSASSGSTEPTWPTSSGASVDEGGMRWYAESLYLLAVPTSPAWMLGKFIQRGETALDALSTLAAQLGWEVRWLWNESAAAFRLTFWSPDRAATTPVLTLKPSQYEYLSQVRTSLEDVRNVVEVVYSDTGDLDAAGQPKRKTLAVTDASSITAVGRRFMRVAEAATSNLNTSSEATTLANAALADLKDTPLGLEVEVDFRPDLELGDVVAVEGNGYHFTDTQQGAVVSLTHSFTSAGASTKLVLLGKPSTSVRRWLSMEQRPATAPASPFTGPSAPSGLSSSTTAGGFKLSFNPPTTGAKAAAYELHVSNSSGFTPDSSTLRGAGNLTELVVTDLKPGTTYYAKVVARDAKGNRGPATSEQTLVPRYVEPRALQPRVTYAALPLNADFEAANDSSAPPDGWQMVAGTWGTTAELVTTSYTGSRAVRVRSGAVLASELWAARPGDSYSVDVAYQPESTSSASGEAKVEWFDETFTSLGVDAGTSVLFAGTTGAWKRGTSITTTPAGTRYMRINVYGDEFTSGRATLVDSLIVTRQNTIRARWARFLHSSLGDSLNDYSNSWVPAGTTAGAYLEAYLDPNTGFVTLRGQVKNGTSGAAAVTLFVGYRPVADTFRFAYASGGVVATVSIAATGAITITSASTTMIDLGGISFPVF